MLWGTDHDVLGGGKIQAAELLYIWEKNLGSRKIC